ncbi:MAG: alkaline phosphatase family protein [Pseudomonadota bacterium]
MQRPSSWVLAARATAVSLLLFTLLPLAASGCAGVDAEDGCTDLSRRDPWTADTESLAGTRLDDDGLARVLILGLDGATGPAVEYLALDTDRAPTLRALMTRGRHASCGGADDENCARAQRSPREDTSFLWVTASGWASVLTGVDGAHHCVKDNPPAALKPFASRARWFPTFFKRAHDLGWGTAAGGVATFVTALQGGQPRPGVLDYECGVDGDFSVVSVDARSSCNLAQRAALVSDAPDRDRRLLEWMQLQVADPSLRVVMGVFDGIDAQGHASGYDRNEGYLDAITEIDTSLGSLLELVQERTASFSERWLVVVTADHGGHRVALWGNHDSVIGEDDAIPFILATYGNTPPLRALTRPVSQLDVHPTVMGWLERASPQVQGQVQGLQ